MLGAASVAEGLYWSLGVELLALEVLVVVVVVVVELVALELAQPESL